MASIKKRPDGRYRGRYRDDAGKEHAQHFARKVDAQKWLDGITASQVRGDYVDPDRKKMTVGAWADTWIGSRVHLKPSTLATYKSLVKTKIRPRWGSVPLSNVENGEVAAWVASMRAAGLSASRVRQTHAVFSAMLDAAVRDRRLPSNPAKVDLPRLPAPSHRYLTHKEVASLAEACGPYRTLVLALAYGGLRFGEAAALRVKRVDVLRGRLDIAEAMTEVNGRAMFGTPKTHQQRSVPLPGFLRDALKKQLADKSGDDFVFASPTGAVLRVNNFRRGWWDDATAKVGLAGLTPHALRHTAASLAISAGATVKGVQGLLGHKSATVTLDIYAGLFGDELDAVANRLDVAARASAKRPRTSRGLAVVREVPSSSERTA